MFAARAGVLWLLLASAAAAHVGSPDVYFRGDAGNYKLLVAIRAPSVIPGVARVEVRSLSPDVDHVELTPMPMTGPGAAYPPTPDVAARSPNDPEYFEASLWLMTSGSWKVRVKANGPSGTGELQVPIPAVALKSLPMQKGVGYFLFGMMLFLSVGMVAIVGAAVRESHLEPGIRTRRWGGKALAIMAAAAALLVVALWRGDQWWGEEAGASNQKIYTPPQAEATLAAPNKLEVHLVDPGWVIKRSFENLLPDHGHVMHLFLIRWPAMDVMYHLHPKEAAAAFFETSLPSVPGGDYRVYADVVEENGLAETAVGGISLPNISGQPLAGDDAGGAGAPRNASAFPLRDGYRMVWQHDPAKPIIARRLTLFSFGIEGPDGGPVNDLEPYMGMGGHAEFLKTDGTVFAHVHPSGTVSMAAEQIASPEAMMGMHQMRVGPTVSFPFGLPSAGDYRIFVQLKRAGKVETGAFDLQVLPAPAGK